MGKINAGELLAGREVIQLFRATEDHLAFISVVFATYARQNRGTLSIALHRMPEDFTLPELHPAAPPGRSRPQRLIAALRHQLDAPKRPIKLGPRIIRQRLPSKNLFDCEPFDFAVGPITTKPGELLALTICSDAVRGYCAPTTWLTDTDIEGRLPGHVACFVDSHYQGEFGVQGVLTYGGALAPTTVPKMLLYSPVTQCNLNCIHCISAHTRKTVKHMSADVKAQMKAWARSGQLEVISSDYSGDILWADSRFGGELDFIFDLDIPFHIDTNGVCLTAVVSERLCQAKIGSLNISLDAARDETFRRVRKGAPPLAEVIENIKALMQARAAAGVTFPVSLSFTIMRSTLTEWPEFVRMGKSLGVDIVISRHLEAFTPEMEPDSCWHDQAAFNAARLGIVALAAELDILVTIPEPFSGIARTARRLCTVPWHSSVILGNGDIAACCVPGLVMGNVNETSLEEIWNGPAYQELRRTVNSSTPPPSCATCPMFRLTDNPDSYLIHSALARITA
ncbi:MAG: radical SAM protein [Acidocella sp.]|nr:radical SAM protein [Acidocella sp.]